MKSSIEIWECPIEKQLELAKMYYPERKITIAKFNYSDNEFPSTQIITCDGYNKMPMPTSDELLKKIIDSGSYYITENGEGIHTVAVWDNKKDDWKIYDSKIFYECLIKAVAWLRKQKGGK